MLEEQAVVVDLKDDMAMLEEIRRKPCDCEQAVMGAFLWANTAETPSANVQANERHRHQGW